MSSPESWSGTGTYTSSPTYSVSGPLVTGAVWKIIFFNISNIILFYSLFCLLFPSYLNPFFTSPSFFMRIPRGGRRGRRGSGRQSFRSREEDL